ncbi:hypothetical protein FHS07_000554 [Microbacterium proteolyticum]|uniref:Uncharacterized protein n=1 Tax=Microbacterium proteolyticum TaxID=1572644 RepID=A0A7W5CGK3_9MICO|nr:hypothetical protein [Microbacterium proteolyticum]
MLRPYADRKTTGLDSSRRPGNLDEKRLDE